MLTRLGYGPDPGHLYYERLQLRDGIILKPNDGSDLSSCSYGFITGRGFDKDRDHTVFVVAPGAHSHNRAVDDYELIVVPASMAIEPQFDGSDGVTTNLSNKGLMVSVDKRRIILDKNGHPAYRYYLRLDVDYYQGELDDGVDEEDMDALLYDNCLLSRLGYGSRSGNYWSLPT